MARVSNTTMTGFPCSNDHFPIIHYNSIRVIHTLTSTSSLKILSSRVYIRAVQDSRFFKLLISLKKGEGGKKL